MEKGHYQKVVITDNGCRLIRAFADISHGFTDWYQATELDVLLAAEEIIHANGHK